MSFIFPTSSFIHDQLIAQLEQALASFISPSTKIIWQFFHLEEKLKIEQVRQLQKEVLQIHQPQATVFFVLNLNQTSVVVQNALLKILEEPPTGVDFVILAQNASFLLPTIVSRCSFLSSFSTKNSHKNTMLIKENNLDSFWQISAWQKFAPTSLAAALNKNFENQLKQFDPEINLTKNDFAYQLFQQFLLDLTALLDQRNQAQYQLSLPQLLQLLVLVKQSLIYLSSNVSPKNVFYYLTINFNLH